MNVFSFLLLLPLSLSGDLLFGEITGKGYSEPAKCSMLNLITLKLIMYKKYMLLPQTSH